MGNFEISDLGFWIWDFGFGVGGTFLCPGPPSHPHHPPVGKYLKFGIWDLEFLRLMIRDLFFYVVFEDGCWGWDICDLLIFEILDFF